jgi:hypothetical protein
MKNIGIVTMLTLTICMSFTSSNEWLKEDRTQYKFLYTANDQVNKDAYTKIIDSGIHSVRLFFGGDFKNVFEVYVHPSRQSLDEQWQKDWNMPDFKSECWMVASGIATKIDMISPVRWTEEACEHSYANAVKTQQLITHELFHVYHAQLNTMPDFSDGEGLDWLVEGFATYASGQLDDARLAEIKSTVENNSAPTLLDNFWKGKMRYGLSGSVVMYIHKKYGKEKLKELLVYNKKEQVLNALSVNETDFLKSWAEYVKGTTP